MDIIYYLWLEGIQGCGVNTINKLIERFGSAKAVYNSTSIDDFKNIEGIRKDVICDLLNKKDLTQAENKKNRILSLGIKFISLEEESYPFILKQIASPPAVLYYKGENLLKDYINCIAIVGTRKSTPYGQSVAVRMASQLAAAGICIVSGLAAGIDYCAHKGALDIGGKTIAVIGSGHNNIYPSVHEDLYNEILNKGGMVISEFLPDTPPVSTNFPRRNRIISGLSKGTLVVEAGVRSGSLITAAYATEQNRDVYAIPGNITQAMSAGPNRLIKDGAKPVCSVNDIFEDLNVVENSVFSNSDSEASDNLSKEEKKLIGAVRDGIQTPDALSRHLQIETAKVNSMITMLEIKQQLKYKMGKLYSTYRR